MQSAYAVRVKYDIRYFVAELDKYKVVYNLISGTQEGQWRGRQSRPRYISHDLPKALACFNHLRALVFAEI